ncbi:MAG: hypothetical protein WA130_11215 [Candidatus Methanoperedens sp.]
MSPRDKQVSEAGASRIDSKELIEQYKINGTEIQRIKGEEECKKEALKEERSKVWEIVHEKRSQLDKEEDKLCQGLDLKEKAIEKDAEWKIAPLESLREAVKRIVQFLEVQETFKPVELKEGMWIPAGEWQDWVYQDDYVKIRLLVHENSKPINKYTTSVCVVCVFGEPLLKAPQNCTDIGYFKTIDEARTCATKKKDKVLRDVIQAVEVLKAEYTQVTSAYKLSDFEEMFEYHCSECRAVFKKVPESHDRETVRYEGDKLIPVTAVCSGGRFYRHIVKEL